jgi:hypothetical protein
MTTEAVTQKSARLGKPHHREPPSRPPGVFVSLQQQATVSLAPRAT